MQIDFNEIPDEGLRVEIDDSHWFPENFVERSAPVKATLFLQRKETRVLVAGQIDTQVTFSCDRCLESAEHPLEVEFDLVLEVGEPMLASGEHEHHCSSGEMDVMVVEKPVVDVGAILRQQVFLALPAKRLCREECKGLCPRCGADLNIKSCECAGEDDSSPFSVLAQLMDKEK